MFKKFLICALATTLVVAGCKDEGGDGGENGDPGPNGMDGTAGLNGKTMFVVDSEKNRIGYFGGLAQDGVGVFMVNDAYSKVDLETGEFMLDVVPTCQYESEDCTGACLTEVAPHDPASNVVIGEALHVSSGEVREDAIANSFWSTALGECVSGVINPLARAYEAKKVFDMPYPFSPPLKVVAQ